MSRNSNFRKARFSLNDSIETIKKPPLKNNKDSILNLYVTGHKIDEN